MKIEEVANEVGVGLAVLIFRDQGTPDKFLKSMIFEQLGWILTEAFCSGDRSIQLRTFSLMSERKGNFEDWLKILQRHEEDDLINKEGNYEVIAWALLWMSGLAKTVEEHKTVFEKSCKHSNTVAKERALSGLKKIFKIEVG